MTAASVIEAMDLAKEADIWKLVMYGHTFVALSSLSARSDHCLAVISGGSCTKSRAGDVMILSRVIITLQASAP